MTSIIIVTEHTQFNIIALIPGQVNATPARSSEGPEVKQLKT